MGGKPGPTPGADLQLPASSPPRCAVLCCAAGGGGAASCAAAARRSSFMVSPGPGCSCFVCLATHSALAALMPCCHTASSAASCTGSQPASCAAPPPACPACPAAYCFYYWYARSDMNGLMQASFYFGYMLMVCYGEPGLVGVRGWGWGRWRAGLGGGRAAWRKQQGWQRRHARHILHSSLLSLPDPLPACLPPQASS